MLQTTGVNQLRVFSNFVVASGTLLVNFIHYGMEELLARTGSDLDTSI